MTFKFNFIFCLSILFLAGCHTSQEKPVKKIIQRTKPASSITYHLENSKTWLQQHPENNDAKKILAALNRTDLAHLKTMDSILVPNDFTGDLAYYLPFPFQVSGADSIDKIILFSYPSQTFAAYENGQLVFTGPTNMGRRSSPTPTGLYFANWKAEKTTSTFDDEWELKWNFNIENKEGIGFHQYDLPGYPASHSCLRLQEADARYLYNWADQWVIEKDTVHFKGTPVIVFGKYDFDAAKPWLKLTAEPHALDITEASINQLLVPYLQEILKAQEKRKRETGTDL